MPLTSDQGRMVRFKDAREASVGSEERCAQGFTRLKMAGHLYATHERFVLLTHR